jgi:carbamoyltransferase
MKDILNSKVKFREWYRPFAPFCLEEHSDKFFKSKDFKNFEFMGYAPIVKDEYCEKLPSITHIDKTSRLQVITKESHNFFYNVLTEFSKKTEIPVLLNTSFNILGNPILSTYEDAFYVLDNTLLDVLVTKDYIIYKN